MKIYKYIFIIFLTGLISTGDVHAFPKPKHKSKTSCTAFRGKFTVADQIDYKYGIMVGRNAATINSERGTSQDIINGLVGGFAFQVIYPKGFVIQPELLYSQKGCLFGGTGVKFNIGYIEMPVRAIYRLHMAEVKPFAFVAPYWAYAIRIVEDGDVMISDNIPSNEINKLDFGIGAGAGFDVWKIQLSFKYSWGFAQVANETYPIRNKVFTVSGGFFF